MFLHQPMIGLQMRGAETRPAVLCVAFPFHRVEAKFDKRPRPVAMKLRGKVLEDN